MANISHQAWEAQPPYQQPDSPSQQARQFDKEMQGACHCGRIKFWLSKDKPLASKYCHCDDCKTIHGAPFQWAAIFQKSDMAFENGIQGLRFYNSASKRAEHELPCKVSCSYCGTLILDEGRNMILLFPTLLSFSNEEQKKNFQVQCHLFYPRRVVEVPDGKPMQNPVDFEV